jgi:hypothetical protein
MCLHVTLLRYGYVSQIAYRRTAISSFFQGDACNVCDFLLLPSLWLGSNGDYSPTAPAARHEWFPDNV